MRNIDKIELATNKLENTFLEQKNIARKLMTEHRQLQEALATVLLNADEDCPSQYRTEHFCQSINDGYSLLRTIGYFKKRIK